MKRIPKYIEKRIRRPIPLGAHVVSGSTPVVSFGDSTTAKVATLGLNPSKVEFLDHSGSELEGPKRRLATHLSLQVTDLEFAPLKAIREILSDCDFYFQRNPYWGWFSPLEDILKYSKFSYLDGTACHLDLVQWATDPTWTSLASKAVREELIQADSDFLREQLSQENIKLILVNGRGVIDQLEKRFGCVLDELEPIEGLGRNSTRIYKGMILDKVDVIAWSTNLQSSHGVTTALKDELKKRISKIVKKSRIAEK